MAGAKGPAQVELARVSQPFGDFPDRQGRIAKQFLGHADPQRIQVLLGCHASTGAENLPKPPFTQAGHRG